MTMTAGWLNAPTYKEVLSKVRGQLSMMILESCKREHPGAKLNTRFATGDVMRPYLSDTREYVLYPPWLKQYLKDFITLSLRDVPKLAANPSAWVMFALIVVIDAEQPKPGESPFTDGELDRWHKLMGTQREDNSWMY